jgi:predicted  nucleic acid-binding Zn-ribbon protein
MAPMTNSEEDLENLLIEAQTDLKNAAKKLSSLRKEVLEAENFYVAYRLQVDKYTEELRRFRDMYPKLCKRDKL